jgi:hypothetical protein
MAKAPKLRPEQTVLVELRERLTLLRELLPTLTRPAATKAILDVEGGSTALRRAIKRGELHGKFDGTSQEFCVTVDRVETPSLGADAPGDAARAGDVHDGRSSLNSAGGVSASPALFGGV